MDLTRFYIATVILLGVVSGDAKSEIYRILGR